MKRSWLSITLAALAVMVAAPAHARHRHKARPHCIDRPVEFSWRCFWANPKPRPNGCSPAVYAYGEFIGQDPDPNIRFQLMRDPRTGYSYGLMH